MIVSITVEGCDGLARVFLLVVVDESEALALTGDLVLGEVDASNASERLEQFLQLKNFMKFADTVKQISLKWV